MNNLQAINNALANWFNNLDFKPSSKIFNVSDALDGFKLQLFDNIEDVCLSSIIDDLTCHLRDTEYRIEVGDFNYKEYEYLLKDASFREIAYMIDDLGLDYELTFHKYTFLLETTVNNRLYVDKENFSQYLVESFSNLVEELEGKGFNV